MREGINQSYRIEVRELAMKLNKQKIFFIRFVYIK
jgi:hypothetical protein